MGELLERLSASGIFKSNGKINSNWAKLVTAELKEEIDAVQTTMKVRSISEMVWCLQRNTLPPACVTCGGMVRFLSNRTYRKFCSAKCAASNENTKLKRTETNLERYGVTNVAKLTAVAKKQSDTAHDRFTAKMLQQIDGKFTTSQKTLNSRDKFEFTCEACGTTGPWRVFSGRTPRCYKCSPHSQSKPHVMVRDMLVRHGVAFIEHERTVISPLELDFYVPALQLAIEVNGIYWHSEEGGHSKFAHQEKTLRCLEKNVTLIHIFEDEIITDSQSIENRIYENYINATGQDVIFSTLEVDGCWPLPQWFSARLCEILPPKLRKIDPRISRQNLTVWDAGTLIYQGIRNA